MPRPFTEETKGSQALKRFGREIALFFLSKIHDTGRSRGSQTPIQSAMIVPFAASAPRTASLEAKELAMRFHRVMVTQKLCDCYNT